MAFSKGAVFFLLAFLSGTLVIEEGECQPVSAIAISEGSPVRTFILNNAGTVAFATGQNPRSADRIGIADSNRSLKIASAGDAVPDLAKTSPSALSYSAGLFIYSSGRVKKVALREDPSPLGGPFFFSPDNSQSFSTTKGQ